MKRDDLVDWGRYEDSHFAHRVGDIWYLIPNEALEAHIDDNDPDKAFNCIMITDKVIFEKMKYSLKIDDIFP